MTKWILLFSALLAGPTLAASSVTDEPLNMCYQGCSTAQAQIWEAFESAQFVAPHASVVYSGACYHLSGDYDNERAHYAVVYLVGDTYFSARFAFFYDSDPYASMTVADAKDAFPNAQTPRNQMLSGERSAIADYSTKDTLWRYWMRSSVDHNTLYLVGMWGPQHDIFCQLGRHAE
jgi:hypothetical protein